MKYFRKRTLIQADYLADIDIDELSNGDVIILKDKNLAYQVEEHTEPEGILTTFWLIAALLFMTICFGMLILL